MSLQDNNDSSAQLEKTLKVAEAFQRKFQLPKSLEMMLNSQKKLEQIYGPSFAMREIFKQQEQLSKTYQMPKTLQNLLDQQQKIKSLFPEYFQTKSGLTFPKSMFSSKYSWHNLLATTDNFSTLQSISKSIANQYAISPETFFSDYGFSALLNIQKQISLLPTDIQTQFLHETIQTVQDLDTTEEIKAEVKAYFDGTSSLDQDPNKRFTITSIALLIIFWFYGTFNDQFQMALFEFGTKPLLSMYLAPKEVKSIVKEEIQKNELNTLYGKRITLTDLNLRDMPKQSATLLETIETGKILNIVNEKGLHKSWLKVEIDLNGEKVQGYVLRRYTTIIKP